MSGQNTMIGIYIRQLFMNVFLSLCADLIISALELLMIYLTASFAVYVLTDPNGTMTKGLHYAAVCMAAIYLMSAFFVALRRYFILARYTPVRKDAKNESGVASPAEECRK